MEASVVNVKGARGTLGDTANDRGECLASPKIEGCCQGLKLPVSGYAIRDHPSPAADR